MSARGLVADTVAVMSPGGAAKAVVVSDGKDLPDNGNGNGNCGDNGDNGEDDNRAINLPDTIGTIELQYPCRRQCCQGWGRRR